MKMTDDQFREQVKEYIAKKKTHAMDVSPEDYYNIVLEEMYKLAAENNKEITIYSYAENLSTVINAFSKAREGLKDKPSLVANIFIIDKLNIVDHLIKPDKKDVFSKMNITLGSTIEKEKNDLNFITIGSEFSIIRGEYIKTLCYDCNNLVEELKESFNKKVEKVREQEVNDKAV